MDERSGQLVFATNAGMFDADYKPIGLYVENGRELVRTNTRSGWGNFHMKPNGIFYVAGERAGVLETGAYLRKQLHPATQSGPMLVINGRLHPRFVHANVSLSLYVPALKRGPNLLPVGPMIGIFEKPRPADSK